MQTQEIFLASSSELKEDRKEFEIFVNRKNKEWVDKGVFLKLIVWEDFLDALSPTRLQDEYNKEIRQCDLFVMLFFTKVGKYTAEEFETAFGQFQATRKPFIFTYFKDAEISTGSANRNDLTSLWAFQDKLNELGHFQTVFKNTEGLLLHFNQQLDKLVASGFIEFKPDKGDAAAVGGATYQATLAGNGAIAQGPGATAASAGGVAIGGNHTGNINTGTQTNIDTGGGAYIGGTVTTGGGKFVGRDDRSQVGGDRAVVIGGDARHVMTITGDGNQVAVLVDQVSTEDLLRGYYRALAQECRRLPLGVVDPRFVQLGDKGKVSLVEVYTDLDVVSAPRADDEAAARWGWRLARGESGERIPLLQAITEPSARRLVLVGDAGSGKTTFVNYVAYSLAEALADGTPPPLPDALHGALPVRLLLRYVAHQIPENGTRGCADLLWQALRADAAERLGEAAADRVVLALQRRLLSDGGLVLLDGLDEVPEAARRRRCLLESIQEFVAGLPADRSRILLTARPYAYADPRWHLAGFPVLALAPFDREQVERFVDRWHLAVRPALGWDRATAEARARRLSGALFQRERAYLADLAARPLLLTLMATLHSSWGQLPDDRADLYEETVKLLLSRWQEHRRIEGPDGRILEEPGLACALKLGEPTIRAALEKLAFRIHQRQGGEAERADAPADISSGEVLSVLTPLLPDDVNPKVLLNYLEQQAGLLTGRREGVYAFPHRSFQEYLAVCHLANSEPDFAARLRDLVWQDLDWWREAFLLGVGKKRQGGLGDAVNVVNTLVPEKPDDVDAPTPRHWQAAALAGEALLELRQLSQVADQPYYRAIIKRVRAWLRVLVEKGHLAPRERLTAGDVLGRLGDPRPGVGVIAGPDRAPAVPDLAWVDVLAGPFTMGSREEDQDAYDDEKPAHRLELPRFQISRYPITNAQYRPFVEAEGYHQEEWWTEAGWAWRRGGEADLSAIDDDNHKKRYAEWLAGRPAERRDRPFWWDDPQWGATTRPVVGVTWYEVAAYCRWLTARLRAAGKLAESATVRLPSEAEWEKAARGSQGRRWPWSDDWEEDCANTEEAGLSETSPVGLFPKGASSDSAYDLAGNVWEWTGSLWSRTSTRQPDYRYPYNPHDGREQEDRSALFVVRGGSWGDDRQYARGASRYWFHPDYFPRLPGVSGGGLPGEF